MASKAKKVGEVIEVPEGAEVTRPDGTVVRVTGGMFVLDAEGTFMVDGAEVAAK